MLLFRTTAIVIVILLSFRAVLDTANTQIPSAGKTVLASNFVARGNSSAKLAIIPSTSYLTVGIVLSKPSRTLVLIVLILCTFVILLVPSLSVVILQKSTS